MGQGRDGTPGHEQCHSTGGGTRTRAKARDTPGICTQLLAVPSLLSPWMAGGHRRVLRLSVAITPAGWSLALGLRLAGSCPAAGGHCQSSFPDLVPVRVLGAPHREELSEMGVVSTGDPQTMSENHSEAWRWLFLTQFGFFLRHTGSSRGREVVSSLNQGTKAKTGFIRVGGGKCQTVRGQ